MPSERKTNKTAETPLANRKPTDTTKTENGTKLRIDPNANPGPVKKKVPELTAGKRLAGGTAKIKGFGISGGKIPTRPVIKRGGHGIDVNVSHNPSNWGAHTHRGHEADDYNFLLRFYRKWNDVVPPKPRVPTREEKEIEKLLTKIFKRYDPNRDVLKFAIISMLTEAKKKKGLKMSEQVKITNEQKVPVKLDFKTATGKAAKVENIRWLVVDGESAIVNPSASGKKAEFISGDGTGTTLIRAKADADLGEGVEEIELDFEVEVVSPRASQITSTIGEPVAKGEVDSNGDYPAPEDDAEDTETPTTARKGR